MEIISHQELRLPIPLYAMFHIADAISSDKANFFVVAGLDENLVAQLKKYSLDDADTDLQENTSDKKRFGEGSYEEWYAKKRIPFALVNAKTGTLAALAWFGPKPLGERSMKHLSEEEREEAKKKDAGDWHTISFRCYGPYRGKGLMTAFTRFAMERYEKAFPKARLWTVANAHNKASSALAEKLGFKPLEEKSQPDGHFLVMVKQ